MQTRKKVGCQKMAQPLNKISSYARSNCDASADSNHRAVVENPKNHKAACSLRLKKPVLMMADICSNTSTISIFKNQLAKA